MRLIETMGVSPCEEIILLALYGRELYGVQIWTAIKEAGEGFRSIKQGTLYVSLGELQEKGLIESRDGEEDWQEIRTGKRKYHRLSPSGVAMVEKIRAFHSALLHR